MTSPDSPYLVCATPRSGATLLCELLTATGVAGRPEEPFERLYATNLPRQPREYFAGVTSPEVLDLLPTPQPGTPESAEAFEQRLTDALRAGTTPNGVWGAQLLWGYFLDLLHRLRERPDTESLRPAAALEHLLPGVRYVQVRRRDKVAQAVSLWTAMQPGEPVYSHGAIEHLRTQVAAQDAAWTSWFAASGIQPKVVVYEDLADDPRGVVREVLRALHVDVHGSAGVDGASLPRQAGGLPAEWVERFERERKAALAV